MRTEIPNLTYQQFKQFHATYYHPANARIYFYGDDDVEERLRLLDERLREFHAIAVNGEIALQEPMAEPFRAAYPYGVDADTDLQKKHYIQLNWLLPENDDRDLAMGLGVLSYALLGTAASPLRKALTESGLGEDVTGGGLGTYLRQMTFGVGMKGVNEGDLDRVEKLILETLHQLATEGIEADTIAAAVNTIEFNLRENNTGSYPRGLSLMVRALSTWLYNRDPLMPLRFEGPLSTLKEQLRDSPTYMQDLLQHYLLENPHRSTVVLYPDAQYNQRLEAAEKTRLQEARAAMDAGQLLRITEQAAELKRIHETPDDPVALAALPMLTLADLEKEVKTLPNEVLALVGGELLYHNLFTNGIFYLNIGFDLHGLPQELLPYVHLFGRALLEMGTDREDYVQLQQRIGSKTGGIWHSTMITPLAGADEIIARFFISGKATVAQVPDLLAILQDVLCTVKLDDRERFRQIVLKSKARNEAGLVPAGHSVVGERLRSSFNTAYWVDEQMGGINYLFFLRTLLDQIDQDLAHCVGTVDAGTQALDLTAAPGGECDARRGELARGTTPTASLSQRCPQMIKRSISGPLSLIPPMRG
ncbi:MAG: insulinase family protein [Caldilineaceae bacterium]